MPAAIPLSRCPGCGKDLHLTTCVNAPEDTRPSPGDQTVCIRCGGLLVFTANLGVRAMTVYEFESLPKSTQTLLTHASIACRTTYPTKN